MLKKLFNLIFLCAFAVVLCFTISSCGKDKGPMDKEYTPEELTELVNSFFDKLEAATLTEDNGSEKKEISLSMNDISYTGNFDSKIDSFYYTPDTMYISGREKMESDGQEVENAYTIFTRAFENGNLRLDTNNGITNATIAVAGEEAMKSLQGVSDIDIAEVIKSFRIKESYIKTTDNARVYEFSGYYLENIIEALTGTDMLGDVDVSDMTVIADFTKFYSDKKVELTVKYNKKDVFVAHVDASKYEYNSGFDMEIELEGTEIKVSLGVFEDRAIKTSISFVSEESSVEFKYEYKGDKYTVSSDTPDKECDAYYLQIVMKEGKTEIINLKLNAAMVEKGALKGAINCTAGLQEGIIPISSSNGVHIEGTFGLQMSRDGIDTATAQLELDAGSLAKGHLVLAYNGANAKKVGEAPLDITLTAANSPDQSLKVKTISYTEEKSSYAIEYIGDEGTARATLNYPATSYKLTETEEKYYQRAKKHFESFEETEKNMKKLNNAAADYVREGLNSDSALKYITKVDSDYAYLTEITLNGSIIYAYTSILVDYENYEYFCPTNVGGTGKVTIANEAPVAVLIRDIYTNINSSIGDSYHHNYITYVLEVHIPQFNAYVYFYNDNSLSYIISNSKLNSSYFNGKCIHSADKDSDFYSVHNFTKTYSDCHAVYTCSGCGTQATDSNVEHISNITEISPLTDTHPKTSLNKCTRCSFTAIVIEDSKGDTVNIEIAPLEQYLAEKYGITDIENKLVISKISCDKEIESFDRKLYIPQLTEVNGKTIVGLYKGFEYSARGSHLPVQLVLPEGIEFIEGRSLYFTYVSALELPSSLTFIGDDIIQYGDMTELIIPENVKTFKMARLNSLTKLVVNAKNMDLLELPVMKEYNVEINSEKIKELVYNSEYKAEVIYFPEYAEIVRGLSNNWYVKKVVIPYGASYLPEGVFNNCTNLKEVILPDTIESLSRVFSGCSSLDTIKLLREDGTVEGEDGKILLPEGLNELGANAFFRCQSIKEIVIPDGVLVISQSAFWECTSLERVVLHDGVTEIGATAFEGCVKLSDINIPASLEKIGASAFKGCILLTDENVVFGTALTTIGNMAFKDCTRLENIVIPSASIVMGADAFNGANLKSLHIKGSLEFTSGWYYLENVEVLTLDAPVTVGNYNYIRARTVNMKFTTAEQVSNMSISGMVSTINFAGSKEQFDAAGFTLDGNTTVNYNVSFE